MGRRRGIFCERRRREDFLKRRLNRRSVIILYSHSVLLALYRNPANKKMLHRLLLLHLLKRLSDNRAAHIKAMKWIFSVRRRRRFAKRPGTIDSIHRTGTGRQVCGPGRKINRQS